MSAQSAAHAVRKGAAVVKALPAEESWLPRPMAANSTNAAASLLHSPPPPPPKPAAEAAASPRRLGKPRGGSTLLGIDLG